MSFVLNLALSSSRRLLVLSLVLALGGWTAWRSVAAQQATLFVTASAASYRFDSIAPESIVAGFGVNLSTQSASGTDTDTTTPGIQLPTTLVGTTVRVNGVAAPLFYVSPGQINYLIPAVTPLGDVPVTVTTASGATAAGTINVRLVAPAIFAANADGRGVPAAQLLRVAANGTQTFETLSAFNQAADRILATPINLGPEGEKVFIILYPTGLRRVPDPNNDGNRNEFTRVIINGLSVVPAYAGPQGSLVGLDQVNVEIPRTLLGSGALDVQIVVTGFGLSNTTGVELVAPPVTGLSFRPLGLPTRTIRAFTTIGSYLFAATDQGVWCSSDSGATWINASNGLPTNADVRTFLVDGTTLYAGLYGGGGVCVSTNNGGSWTALNNGLVGSTLNISNLLFFGGSIYAATQGGVCRYVSGAWVALNTGLTNVDATTLVIAGGRLCVGTRGGGIFLFASGNSSWGSISNGLPTGAQVLSLVSAGGAVYAGLNGGGLCISRNGGTSWTQVAGGLPGSAVVNSIWVDGPRCYVGTSSGVYVTNDSGVSWNLLSNGLSGCSGANNTNAVFAFASRLLTGSTGCGVYGSALAAGATNRAPIAYDQTVSFTEDTPIVISLSGFDADLDPLTYSIVAGPARGSLNGTLPNITYTPDINFNGRTAFTFRVNDGRQNSNTATISLEGSPINDAPVLTVPGAQTVTVNQPLTFTVSATDPDAGQTVTLSATGLPSGATFNAATGAFAWTPTVAGGFTLTFTATDNGTPALTNTRTVSVTVNGAVTTWQPLGTGLSGIGQVWALHAAGATIYAGGGSGIYRSTNSGANWADFSSGLNATNRLIYRLAFISDKLYAATTGGLYVLNDAATSWTKINNGLPTAQVLSIAGTGATLFVGTRAAGTYRSTDGGATFTLFSSQAFGASSEAGALFIIGDYVLAGGYDFPNQGLYRSFISSPNWTYMNSFGLDVPASFQLVNNTLYAGGNGYLYLSTDSGLTWERSAARVPGTGEFWDFVVTEEGAYCSGVVGLVYFTNNNGATWTNIQQGAAPNTTLGLIRDGNRLLLGGVNIVYTRPLSGVSANRPPVLTVPAAQTVTTGQALNFTVSATDPDAGQTVTLSATGLPSGATFTAATGQFSWTPTVAGSYTLTFTATDNGTPALTNTRTVSVTVNAPPVNRAPVLTVPAAQTVTTGQLLSFTVSATDPDAGQTVTLSATGLPSGATFNAATGAFAWTPGATGTFTLTFTATDNGTPALTHTRTVTVTVNTPSTNGQWTSYTNAGGGAFTSLVTLGNIVIGGGDSGVFRSTNGGVAWADSSDGLTTANAVRIASLSVVGTTVYAGTFAGLYRSTDSGATWVAVNATGLPASRQIRAVYGNGSALLLTNDFDAYRSTDNGATWTAAGFTGNLANARTFPLGVLGSTVIAIAANNANGYAHYRSTDFGANWTYLGIDNGTYNGINANFQILGLGVNGTNLFVLTTAGFYLSTNSGTSFGLITPSGFPAGTGFGSFVVGNGVLYTRTTTGVYFSVNNGTSWTAMNTGAIVTGATAIAASNTFVAVALNTGNVAVSPLPPVPASPTGNWTSANSGLPANALVRDFVARGNEVFAASSLGLFKTANNGANWTQVSTGSVTETNFYSISLVGDTLYAGSRSFLLASTNGGESWTTLGAQQQIFLTIVGVVGVGNTLVALGDGSLSATSARVFVSTNNGQTWTLPATNLPTGVYNNILLKGSSIFVGGYSFSNNVTEGVMRSDNSGASWVSAGTGLTAAGPFALALKGTDLFAGGAANGVYRSTNNGTSWAASNGSGSNLLPVATAYHAMAANDSFVFAAGNQAIYFSANDGAAWSPMTGASVPSAVSLLIVGSRIYAGTPTGVFVSPLPGTNGQ